MRKWRWKCQWGEERKYSGYKNQIFVSGLLPSCKCPPFGGLTVCVQLHQQDRPSESKGGNRKKEVAETQCGLYHLHAAARHWQLRNTTTYICCHATLKTNTKNDSRHTVGVNTSEQMCSNSLGVKPSTPFVLGWKKKKKVINKHGAKPNLC